METWPSASIGIAYHPFHGDDYEMLRRNADIAMYTAKMCAKGGVAFFNRGLAKKAFEKHLLEQRLWEALKTSSFRYALQKDFDIRIRELIGFEVLLRWVDESGDVRRPAYCLALTNGLGLLDSITNMLLDDLLLISSINECPRKQGILRAIESMGLHSRFLSSPRVSRRLGRTSNQWRSRGLPSGKAICSAAHNYWRACSFLSRLTRPMAT